MIIIIDYGMGNIRSIANMFRKIGVPAAISSEASAIESAEKLVLPGVGSFDHGMERLITMGLKPIIEKRVLEDKIPVLGICLGMQLLTGSSEEGERPGLGWIDGRTVRFRFEGAGQDPLKIPHMGWNTVSLRQPSPLLDGLDEPQRFYFVHSYHVTCENPNDIAATTHYGYNFVSVVQHGNIMGTQFHPEKSHRFGMSLLAKFGAL